MPVISHIPPTLGTPYSYVFYPANIKSEPNPQPFQVYGILGEVNYNDPNTPDMYGIAVIGVTATDFNGSGGIIPCAGTWEYVNDDGSNIYTALGVSNGSLDPTNALLLRGEAFIRYLPANQYEANVSIHFVGWDQYGTTSGHWSTDGAPFYWDTSNESVAFTSDIGVGVTWVNQAPTLTSASAVINSCSIGGNDVFNPIFDILTSLGYSGSNYQNSANPPGQRGIAISEISSTNGTWYYYNLTTDTPLNLTSLLTDVSSENVCVIGQLFNNSVGFLQFSPSTEDGEGSIEFHAWDSTQFYDPDIGMVSPPAYLEMDDLFFLNTLYFSIDTSIGGATPFSTQTASLTTSTPAPPTPPEPSMTQNTITQVNVTVNRPPAPSKLQKTGCFVSHGGTNTANGTSTLITEMADLSPILAGSIVISAASWASSVASFTTATVHGLTTGDPALVSGMTPSGYNGSYASVTVVDTTHFTVPLIPNPGSATVFGVVTDQDVSELVAMFTTFFAQGQNVSTYVLELGHGATNTIVAALDAYLIANPLRYYTYTVPRGFDANTNFHTLVGNYNTDTSLVYFYVSCTISTYANFSTKNVYALIEAPVIPITEFSIAFRVYWTANQNPSSTNQVPPSAYSYALGVTPYPIDNQHKTLFQIANCNYIGTGAEGGISAYCDFYGVMANGDALNLWYSVDWVQINIQLSVSNDIINGSNRQPPLYYSQPGINELQQVSGTRMRNGITYGLVLGNLILTKLPIVQFIQNVNNGLYLGNAVINAEPFNVYSAENPLDYSLEQYNGLTCVYTPQLGFKHIIFNVQANLFV